jgi:hypothetical protein
MAQGRRKRVAAGGDFVFRNVLASNDWDVILCEIV